MKPARNLLPRPLLLVAAIAGLFAQTDQPLLPRIVQKAGRYALFVDGAPYLILGAQVNNSSAWPAMLPKVWPAPAYLEPNTVEIPASLDRFEPEPGRFAYST